MFDLYFFFSFRGRLNRSGYWIVISTMCVIDVIVLGFLSFMVDPDFVLDRRTILIFFVSTIVVWLSISSACVRRLHDLDHSGWWALLLLIFSFPVIILLGCVRGDKGINHFGPAPAS
jgi:uncharacterized membrane protein YhaH (DUF805 family)